MRGYWHIFDAEMFGYHHYKQHTSTLVVDDPKIEIDKIVNAAKLVINLF